MGGEGMYQYVCFDFQLPLPRGASCRSVPLRFTYGGHLGAVAAVLFVPGKDILVSASHDQTVRLWNLTSGAAMFRLSGHESWVTSLAISADGNRFASGGDKECIEK